MNEMMVAWEERCLEFARHGTVTTRLGLTQDPGCGLSALRYLAEHDDEQAVRDAAAQMMQRREMGNQQPLFGDAN